MCKHFESSYIAFNFIESKQFKCKNMNRTVGRISVSRKPEELLTLASQVFAKHQDDGAASPLSNLDGYDWTIVGPTIEQALARHREAEALKGQMEKAYRERDLLIEPIDETVKASRNLLKALNQKNPKRLADWGFQVADTAPQAKAAKAE